MPKKTASSICMTSLSGMTNVTSAFCYAVRANGRGSRDKWQSLDTQLAAICSHPERALVTGPRTRLRHEMPMHSGIAACPHLAGELLKCSNAILDRRVRREQVIHSGTG